jgi:hypothetical protein
MKRRLALAITASTLVMAWCLYAGPEPKADLAGVVEAVTKDGKTITVKVPPAKRGAEPSQRVIKISDKTKLQFERTEKSARVGQAIEVWLEKNSRDEAKLVRLSPPGAVRTLQPNDARLDPRLQSAIADEKPELREYAAPRRDPLPIAARLDKEIEQHLGKQKVPPSEPADDAEFLRRITLDLTGRVPSYQRTVAFLASTDPHKRRNLIEDLLASASYSDHFATIWRNLIVGKEELGKDRSGRDVFAAWLTEQFAKNHGWNKVVAEMLTAEGSMAKAPATVFTLAHAENGQPQPGRLADATARLFWGIQLRCAECHNHPFAQWKQNDFWATAAFFSRLRQRGGPGDNGGLAETADPGRGAPVRKPKDGAGSNQPLPVGAIVIPGTAGAKAGQVVKARFLGGIEPELDKEGPFRPHLAAWATAADNPFFARATVNRWWAHFFGRGLVEPLDGFDESSEPSHPKLLDQLTREFTASGFDLKHLCRVIVSTKAYQRSSRPVKGNEGDKRAYSHMYVKPLSPEVFYDSVMVVTQANRGPFKVETRANFAKAFQALPESGVADSYEQGVLQMLKLLNAPLLNRGAPVINTLAQANKSSREAIDTLYLTALSRRPSDNEIRLMTRYLEQQSDAREGYAGVLWILLNTSEFASNH